jgi:hypothetical protein
MDLNGIIFASPSFDYCIEDYESELIFVEKKKKDKSTSSSEENSHIPCLLLQAKLKSLSKYFMVFFHGNAEDIFIARDIAEKLKDYLHVRKN